MLSAINKNKWLQSFGIGICLFLLVNLFLHPLFNSGDDVFLMYTLGGGFGETPSSLLHYDHIWHPLLGWVVKTLFSQFPSVNWYSVFLIVFHLAGCTVIFYVFLQRFQWVMAFILFMILFVFFETRSLLSLNFTATSWMLATSGCLLLHQYILKEKRTAILFLSCILLLFAGLLRLHILFAVIVLFLPVFFLYAPKRYKLWMPVIIAICAVIFLANLQHKSFYRKNIPGWQAEENKRQTLFYAYNKALNKNKPAEEIFGDSVTRAFYLNYFFYDTSFISSQKIKGIVNALARNRDFSIKEDIQVLYWVFIELRVYILLALAICFLLWQQKLLRFVLWRWLLSSFLVFAFYGYLFLFLKITEPVQLGSLLLLYIFLCLAIPGENWKDSLRNKNFRFAALLLLLPFSWMLIRVMKKDKMNVENHKRFECVVTAIRDGKDRLFITTDDALPLDYFCIWDTPKQYPLPNLIYKDMVINNCFMATAKRFGVSNIMQAIYQNENVYLLGRDFPELKEYYKEKDSVRVNISAKLPGYSCLDVRKLSPAQ